MAVFSIPAPHPPGQVRIGLMNKAETSWANARVKLHPQVQFGSKRILGPKKCWVQKVLIPKKFWVLS